jgi:hypothetical protein
MILIFSYCSLQYIQLLNSYRFHFHSLYPLSNSISLTYSSLLSILHLNLPLQGTIQYLTRLSFELLHTLYLYNLSHLFSTNKIHSIYKSINHDILYAIIMSYFIFITIVSKHHIYNIKISCLLIFHHLSQLTIQIYQSFYHQ